MATLASASVAASGATAHPVGALVVTKGRAVKQIAAEGRRLVWETGPLEGGSSLPTLYGRKLGGPRRLLIRNVNTSYGLGLAAGWALYAGPGARTPLTAIAPDGSHRIVLSHWLAAPFVTRGRLAAWIEQHGRRQKVVVRNMRTGRVLLAAMPPRCQQGHCFQIEEVALADRGVVFTRDSTNPDFSLVVRIPFASRKPSSVRIPGDPQPDLAPSSAGALYYVLRRGWYRWGFGRKPRRTPFRANPPAPLLGYEHGRWLLSTKRGCDYGVVAVTDGGRRTVVVSARSLERLLPARPRRCVLLQATAWIGAQPLTAWALVPEKSSEEHSDRGLVGVGFAGKRLR